MELQRLTENRLYAEPVWSPTPNGTYRAVEDTVTAASNWSGPAARMRVARARAARAGRSSSTGARCRASLLDLNTPSR